MWRREPSEFTLEPRPGEGPLAVDGPRRRTEFCGDLLDCEAEEVAHFHDLSGLGMLLQKGFEGFVQLEDVLFWFHAGDTRLLQFEMGLTAAAFLTAFGPGLVDEDLSHGGGCHAHKVGSAFELALGAQLQPGLVDQRRRLERLRSAFIGQATACDSSQFLVHGRQNLIRGDRWPEEGWGCLWCRIDWLHANSISLKLAPTNSKSDHWIFFPRCRPECELCVVSEVGIDQTLFTRKAQWSFSIARDIQWPSLTTV